MFGTSENFYQWDRYSYMCLREIIWGYSFIQTIIYGCTVCVGSICNFRATDFLVLIFSSCGLGKSWSCGAAWLSHLTDLWPALSKCKATVSVNWLIKLDKNAKWTVNQNTQTTCISWYIHMYVPAIWKKIWNYLCQLNSVLLSHAHKEITI